MNKTYLIDEDDLVNILLEMIEFDINKKEGKSLLKKYIKEKDLIDTVDTSDQVILDLYKSLEEEIEKCFLTRLKSEVQKEFKKYIFHISLGGGIIR